MTTGTPWHVIGSFIGAPVGLLVLLHVIRKYGKKKDIRGKVVFITGASSGLGEGIHFSYTDVKLGRSMHTYFKLYLFVIFIPKIF